MKKLSYWLLALIPIFTLTFCSKETSAPTIPTAAEFQALQTQAVNNMTQQFQVEVGATFTSEKGVIFTLPASGLNLNGTPVTGMVDVDFVEVFDRGSMLVVNKPTMAIGNGSNELLTSGGEFYFGISQNGQALSNTGLVRIQIPSSLTGGTNEAMSVWFNRVVENTSLWLPSNDSIVAGPNYYDLTTGGNFRWVNCDVFNGDSRPKTLIDIELPIDFNTQNSKVYFAFDEDQFSLGEFYSYQQFPIGLECKLIFVTAELDEWRYAVQSVTITENAIYTFTIDETTVVKEVEMIDVINGLY